MLPYPAFLFSHWWRCNPARDFEAGFGWHGDCVGTPEENRLDIRVVDDGWDCGGLDARELGRRRAFGDAATCGGL